MCSLYVVLDYLLSTLCTDLLLAIWVLKISMIQNYLIFFLICYSLYGYWKYHFFHCFYLQIIYICYSLYGYWKSLLTISKSFFYDLLLAIWVLKTFVLPSSQLHRKFVTRYMGIENIQSKSPQIDLKLICYSLYGYWKYITENELIGQANLLLAIWVLKLRVSVLVATSPFVFVTRYMGIETRRPPNFLQAMCICYSLYGYWNSLQLHVYPIGFFDLLLAIRVLKHICTSSITVDRLFCYSLYGYWNV